jgi:hypothetical protein
MESITLEIPPDWLEGLSIDQDSLRQALMLGLAQLHRQQTARDDSERVAQVLLGTGRVAHLTASPLDGTDAGSDRQVPPTLSGLPVSEILIAQRRGDM